MRGQAIGATVLFLGLAACGGGGGDKIDGNGNGGTPNFSITLTASPTEVSIPIGESRQVTLTVTRGGNYGGAVTLAAEGLPAYVNANFNPPSSGGTATSTSVLTLTPTAQSPAGTYSIVISASGDSVTTQRVTIGCSLVQVPKIAVTVGAASVAVATGSAATVPVTVSRSGGFTGPVNLALEGAPAGLTGTFAPNPVDGTTSALTLSAAATTAPNDYQLTVRATGTGVPDVTAPLTVNVSGAPSYSLLAEPTSISIRPPGTAAVKIRIQRTGGFTGAVSLFTEAFPAGITATITPSPTTGNEATMTVTVPETANPDQHTLFVRGEAAGQPNRKTSVALTVETTPSFTLRPSSGVMTLVPGGSEQGISIGIDRFGGFAGEVAFSAPNVPAGLTVRFSPSSTTGTATTLFVSAASTVTPGTATLQVLGRAAGFADRAATVLINIVAGGTSIAWRFCSTDVQPVFFAYADGASLFTAVAPGADGSYTINIATGHGTVLYVMPQFTPLGTDRMRRRLTPFASASRMASRTSWQATSPALASAVGYTTYVSYATTAELQAMAQPACPASNGLKTLTGSVAGVGTDQGYGVALGSALALGMPGTPTSFTLMAVPDGVHDLLAARFLATQVGDDITATPNKIIARRGLNPPTGSVLPVLDFNGSEAFDPVSAPVTVTNAGGNQLEVTTSFSTANGTNTYLSAGAYGGGTSQTFYGLPAAKLLPGDLHWIIASDDKNRNATLFSHEVVPRTVPLGPDLTWPLVGTYATTPTLRLHAVLNGLGAPETGYGGSFDVTFTQPGTQRALILSYSRGAIGTSNNVEVRTPVLTNIPSWNEAVYALQLGSQVQWSINAWSVADTFVPTDGSLMRWVNFVGTFMP